MRSFYDISKREVIVPPFVALAAYRKLLECHQDLQIGKGATESMAREVRYTDVADAKRDFRRIGKLIGKANETRNRRLRAAYLYVALETLVDNFLNVRILLDLHFLTDVRFANLSLHMEELRRQLNGWYGSTLREVETQQAGKPMKDDGFELLYDIPLPPSVMIAVETVRGKERREGGKG